MIKNSPARLYLDKHNEITENPHHAVKLLIGEGCPVSVELEERYHIQTYFASKAAPAPEQTKAIESAPENKAVTLRKNK